MNWLRLGLSIGAVVVAAGLFYLFGFLPWQLRRGTTSATLQRALPGDELVPNPMAGCTQTIII